VVASLRSVVHGSFTLRQGATAGVLAALAALAAAPSLHPGTAPRPAPSRVAGLEGLPLGARGPVAAALGAVDRAYLVHGGAAWNPAQRLRVRFSREGIGVTSGGAYAAFALQGYGHRGALAGVSAVRPGARANRVTYARGALREWYANGPLGVEQGFDVAARPRAGAGPLTFAMRITGDLATRHAHDAIALSGHGVRLRYGGLVATDARGRALRAWLELDGARLLLEVDDRGARYPLRIDPLIQQADVTASDGAAGDVLGASVAVSGNAIVAGAPFHEVGSNKKQGVAYLFVEPPGGWTNTSAPSAELTASDGAAGDLFGLSVAISGTTVVVGAAEHESSQGAAYVFAMPPSGWAGSLHESAELTAAGGNPGDLFGSSVAVLGNVVVVGAPERKVEAEERQGRAYVFVEPVGGWSGALNQNARLDASDGVKDDEVGHSVAIDGSTIAVGADEGNSGKGAGYVFTMPAEGWSGARTENAELTAKGGEIGDELGYSIAISGATVVAGANGRHVTEGAAYVFTMPPAGWSGTVKDSAELTPATSGGSDEAGKSVAVSGTNVVVGAPGRGSALLFAMPAGGWSGVLHETSGLVAADASVTDLGEGVGVSGQTVVGGAPARVVGSNAFQGSVYVFAPPAPTVAIASPASGAVYTQAQSVAAAYSCSAASPATLSACTGPSVSGAPIDTATPGAHTFTVTATDSEGFRTTQSVAYTVAASPAPGGGLARAASPAPALSHVTQAHTSWRRGGKLATLAKSGRKPPTGTAFSFTLNTAADIKLAFTQRVGGRKVGGKCVLESSHNKRRGHCLRTVTVGTLSLPAVAPGSRRISFQGRLSRRTTLKPGPYSVTISATNASGRASAKALAFTIVK
jgi:hypothetical protein